MVICIRALIDKTASVMSKLNYTNFFTGWVHKSEKSLFRPSNLELAVIKWKMIEYKKPKHCFLPVQYSNFHFLKSTMEFDVEMSVITNSPSQGSCHPDDQIPSRYVTLGFKPSSKNTLLGCGFISFYSNGSTQRSSYV